MPSPTLMRLLRKPPTDKPMVQRIQLPQPLRGIHSEGPPEKIPGNQLVKLRNWRTYSDEMRLRDGLTKRGAVLDTRVMSMDEFSLESGTTYQLAVTKGKLWRWDGTSAYVEITKGGGAGAGIVGGDDRQVASEVIQELFVFSDGTYGPFRWDGVTANPYDILNANAKPFATAVNFADRLVVGRTQEGGVVKPLRVRWPVSGDVTNWIGPGSGFVDLRDTPDWIQLLDTLSTDLAVYKERSIHRGTPTGIITPPISFGDGAFIDGTGLLFKKGLANLGDEHLFVGPDAIYRFRWSNLDAIDEDIHTEFYSLLNMQYLDRMFSMVVEEFSEWQIYIVRPGKTAPDFVWVYNYFEETWDAYELGFPVTAPGFTSRDTGVTFDQLSGTMDSQQWTGDDRTTQFASPVNLLARDNGQVHTVDPSNAKDDTIAISAEGVSKDFESEDPNVEVTVTRVILRYRYAGVLAVVTVGVSTDGGVTFKEQAVTVKAGNSLEAMEVHADIIATGTVFRFRAKTTQQVRLIGFRVWVSGRGLRIS